MSGNAQKLAVNTSIQPADLRARRHSGNLRSSRAISSPSSIPRRCRANSDGSDARLERRRGTPASARRRCERTDRHGACGARDFTPADRQRRPTPWCRSLRWFRQCSASATPYPHTQLFSQIPLAALLQPHVTTVNANVGLATAGSSVSEIMGSGSAATPNQSFKLKQSPLTYVQAVTPTGRQSTLQVTANGVTWNEVPTLYQQGRRSGFRDAESARMRRRQCCLATAWRAPRCRRGRTTSRRTTASARAWRAMSAAGAITDADRPAAGRERRDQSAGGDRRAGPAIRQRYPQQRAALGA